MKATMEVEVEYFKDSTVEGIIYRRITGKYTHHFSYRSSDNDEWKEISGGSINDWIANGTVIRIEPDETFLELV